MYKIRVENRVHKSRNEHPKKLGSILVILDI